MRKLLLVAVVFTAMALVVVGNLSAQTQATHTWVALADYDHNKGSRTTLWATSTVFLSKTASGGDFYNVYRDGLGTNTGYVYTWASGGDTLIAYSGCLNLWDFPANDIAQSAADTEMYAVALSGLSTNTLTRPLGTRAVDVSGNSYLYGVPGTSYAAATSDNTAGRESVGLDSVGFSAGVMNGTSGEVIAFIPTLASDASRSDVDDTVEFGPTDLRVGPAARSGSPRASFENKLRC